MRETELTTKINELKVEIERLQNIVAYKTNEEMQHREQMQGVKQEVLKMIGNQLQHYMKGFHMKMEPNVLNFNMVLSDGHAVKNLIRVYQLLQFSTPETILRYAVNAFPGMAITEDGIGIRYQFSFNI